MLQGEGGYGRLWLRAVTGWQQWRWLTAASAGREVVAGAGRGRQCPAQNRAKQSKQSIQRRHGRTTAAAEHRRRLVARMDGEEWPAVSSGTAQ